MTHADKEHQRKLRHLKERYLFYENKNYLTRSDYATREFYKNKLRELENANETKD